MSWTWEILLRLTGGFTPEKIRQFEELGVPVDVYGVGSYLFSTCNEHGTNNDYTADVVRVKIEGEWYPMGKVGRTPGENPALERVA